MKTFRTRHVLAAMILLGSLPVQAGWQDWMKSAGELFKQQPQLSQGLDQAEVVAGLREALAQGTRNAILSLGREDGFLGNAGVRIPLPAPMDQLESKLRQWGLNGPLDAFALSINRAAEKAVPQVADIFSAAVQALTIEDAMSILQGEEDAATRYFERQTRDQLDQRIRPLVARSTAEVGVTQAYKAVSAQAGPWSALLGEEASDLDAYVTSKTLNGLFATIAEEEKKIRENPAARGTELLRRVFE